MDIKKLTLEGLLGLMITAAPFVSKFASKAEATVYTPSKPVIQAIYDRNKNKLLRNRALTQRFQVYNKTGIPQDTILKVADAIYNNKDLKKVEKEINDDIKLLSEDAELVIYDDGRREIKTSNGVIDLSGRYEPKYEKNGQTPTKEETNNNQTKEETETKTLFDYREFRVNYSNNAESNASFSLQLRKNKFSTLFGAESGSNSRKGFFGNVSFGVGKNFTLTGSVNNSSYEKDSTEFKTKSNDFGVGYSSPKFSVSTHVGSATNEIGANIETKMNNKGFVVSPNFGKFTLSLGLESFDGDAKNNGTSISKFDGNTVYSFLTSPDFWVQYSQTETNNDGKKKDQKQYGVGLVLTSKNGVTFLPSITQKKSDESSISYGFKLVIPEKNKKVDQAYKTLQDEIRKIDMTNKDPKIKETEIDELVQEFNDKTFCDVKKEVSFLGANKPKQFQIGYNHDMGPLEVRLGYNSVRTNNKREDYTIELRTDSCKKHQWSLRLRKSDNTNTNLRATYQLRF